MRILHITPDIYEGGVATLIAEMCRYQYKAGYDVSILCLVNSNNQKSRKKSLEGLGANVLIGKYKHPYDLRNIWFIRKIIKDYDIVHVHLFPNQLFSKLAYLSIDKRQRPIIITTEHNTFNNRRKFSCFKKFDRWLYSTYNSIVCISNQTELNLKEWLGNSRLDKKILTITNGVNIEKYRNNGNCKNDNEIIMVSRLEYPKDPLTLVRAVGQCNQDVSLTFVGSGNLSDEILREAKKLGIDSRVKLLGNRTDVPELLSKAALGVLSTNWDGFGLVAVEYMAAGLPVLASDVDGLRDVVGDSDSLFKCGDFLSLSQKIDRLLSDKNFYQQKKKSVLDRCKEFSIERMNAAYINLYMQLKDNRTPKSLS